MAEQHAVFDRLGRILVGVLSVDPARIVPPARVMTDLGAESIDLLDLRFRVEREFGLRISNQELATAFGPKLTAEQFRELFTVGAIVGYVEQRLGAPRG